MQSCPLNRNAIAARLLSAIALALALNMTAVPSALGGDWPQILGPRRNGQAEGEALPARWPKDGPPVLWSHKVGSGFAGPAVKGDRVLVFHRVGDQERLSALSADNGKPLWTANFDATYRGTFNPDDGPRCVPLIHGDSVIAYGAAGDLHCVDLATGRKRWSRAAAEDYKAPDGYFGAGSSPIAVGDVVLVNVGGDDGAGIVAFSLTNGKTLWKSGEELASYSSPVLTSIDGRQRVVFVTRYNALVVNPADGAIVSSMPFGKRGPTVNAASPVVFGDKLFLTASYSIGAHLVKLSRNKMTQVWHKDDTLSSQYNTPVYRDGHLYGIHGREDIGRAALRCIHAETGKMKWSQADFGVANIILVGDKLLVARVEGELVLAAASADKYVELARARVFDGTARALPALANGKLFARDSDELKCVNVGAQ